MSINLTTGIIPFTELFERLMTLAKIDSFNNEDYAKGLINDAYTRALPGIGDWNCITKDAFLVMSAYYMTGTVACTAGSTLVTGTGTAWTLAMTIDNGWRIKFAGLNNVYEFTRTGDTSATINPPLEGSTDLTAQGYTLFRDEYALPADFDRFLRNGSIYVTQGGRLYNTIEELPRDKFRAQFFPDALDPIFRAMLTRVDSNGCRMVRLNPPPRTARVYPIDYIPKVAPMREYTVGTVAVVNGSMTVTGTNTLFVANCVAGSYFRVDTIGVGDSSKWYKILSVDSNTQLTLASVYEDAADSGVDYTVCTAPTSFPPEFHEFILYEAVSVAVASADDPNTQAMIGRRSDVLNRLNKNYKSRRTNSQYGVDDDGYR
jgi:hypothetical protein